MIIAFAGHRPNKLGGYNLPNPTYIHVCQQIDKLLREFKPEKVISGMALGVDQWAVNIAIKLKIPFIAAIPFKGQEKKWPESSQAIYHKLLSKAYDVVFVSKPGFSSEKMQARNIWMVDQCDLLIGIYDGSISGTGNCIDYAKSVGKEIVIINPNK
ncbi:MAG: SLOG family protein [Candidatus Paceibacterota bacterium]|jgi:uncharacterized phage-like protein YoqJ